MSKNLHRLIASATKTVPVEQSFLADLNYVIMKSDKGRKPSQSYKPSSLVCIRNMFYQRMGETPESGGSADLTGMGQSGSDRHERLQTTIAKMRDQGVDCDFVDIGEYIAEHNLDHLEVQSKQGMETKLWHKHLNMSFLCDGIIRYKGKYYILEIKTETINKWYSREGVADEHRPQATCYSLSLCIDDVLFLYENRDMCGKKTYMLTVTNEMKQQVAGKIEECEGYVKRLTAPPKPLDVEKKTCSYCRYKSACRRDGK